MLLGIHHIQRLGLHRLQAGLDPPPLLGARLAIEQRANLHPIDPGAHCGRHPAADPPPAGPGLRPQFEDIPILPVDPKRFAAGGEPGAGLSGLLMKTPGLQILDQLVAAATGLAC